MGAGQNAGGWCRPASDVLFVGSNADGTIVGGTPGGFLNRTNGHNHASEAYGSTGYPAPYGTEGSSQPYSFHPGGLQVVLGDGAVKYVDEGIATEVLSALITRNGGARELPVTPASL